MVPDDRRYSETHEWVKKLSEEQYLIGVTPSLLRKLGQLIVIDLPDLDDELMIGLPFGELESEDEVHEMHPPMDGSVNEVNETVFDDLDQFAADPLEKGWLLKIKAHTPAQFDKLLEAIDYEKHCDSERRRA